MPPRGIKRKLDSSPSKSSPLASPTKKSAKAQGKQRAVDPDPEPSPAPAPAPQPRQPFPRRDDPADDSDTPEPDLGDIDELPLDRQSFVTASSGDQYLIHSARTSKTSDSLLSSSIDPAFTLSSYADALEAYDTKHNATSARRNELATRAEEAASKFSDWQYELEQGFNILLYGFGSKRSVLSAFADRVRKSGDAVVVNGFDPLVTFPDIVGALEALVRVDEVEDELPKTKKGKGKAVKGKGNAVVASTGVAPPRPLPPPSQVSATECRVRRLCDSLSSPQRTRPIFLIIHNLDGPTLRLPKTLSLLALLTAHPRIHLLSSIDHIRSPLLFSSSLSNARPLYSAVDPTLGDSSSRAFTFIYHEISTLQPYTLEVSTQSLLSKILPPTVFPRLATSSSASFSPINSAIYVLKSVTTSSQKLFSLLATLQLAVIESLDSAIVRSANLAPTIHQASPQIATSLETLTERAADQLIALGGTQKVEALLSEFRDHGVVGSGVIPPEGNDDEEATVWVWIALSADELEEVLGSNQWKE
ncbi:origin recognition complex subunit 2, partial [Phenoliferia sp. Uapishka_3]